MLMSRVRRCSWYVHVDENNFFHVFVGESVVTTSSTCDFTSTSIFVVEEVVYRVSRRV